MDKKKLKRLLTLDLDEYLSNLITKDLPFDFTSEMIAKDYNVPKGRYGVKKYDDMHIVGAKLSMIRRIHLGLHQDKIYTGFKSSSKNKIWARGESEFANWWEKRIRMYTGEVDG